MTPRLGAGGLVPWVLIAATALVGCSGETRGITDGQSSATPSASTSATEKPAEGVDRAIGDKRIGESSGLASSIVHPGVLYTHNDAGSGAEVFAITEGGETAAVLTLRGVTAIDWEDIAVSPDRKIWIADIGDNRSTRATIRVYVVPEPRTLQTASVKSTSYAFRYENGPRNAEAIMINPRTGRVYVVSKEPKGGSIYAAPEQLSTKKVNTLTRVAAAPANVTAGSYSRSGERFALRNHPTAYLYDAFGERPWVLKIPRQRQGESLTFDGKGESILVGSEGKKSKVLRLQIPASIEDPGSATSG